MLFALRSVGGDLKKGLFGTKERPLVSASPLKEWKIELRRVFCLDAFRSKAAILEADAFADRVLADMGYAEVMPVHDLARLLPNIFGAQWTSFEAHEIRNRIVHDRDFRSIRSEAARVLKLYRDLS